MPWSQWGKQDRQARWGGGSAPVFTVSGTVTDWEGNALSGVLMTLTGGYTDTTAVDGTYTIPLVPAGSYTLTPSKSGVTFNPTSRAITITNANVTANFAEQTYTLSGTVSGDVASGVTITLTGDQSDSTTTAGDGTYSFTLPNGSYTVTPSKTDYTFTPSSTNVTVAGGNQTGKDFTSAADIWASLPLTYGWNSGDSAPTLGSTQDWDGEATTGVSVTGSLYTADSYTPSDYTGALYLVDETQNIALLYWNALKARGQTIDINNDGIRFMALLCQSETANPGYKGTGWEWGIGDSKDFLTNSIYGYALVTDPGPDSTSLVQYLGGVKTVLSSFGAIDYSGDIGDYNQVWLAVGMEIPAGFGTVKMRCRSWGPTAGKGAEHSGGETINIASTIGDFSGVDFDLIRFNVGYSNNKGTYSRSQVHWIWVGTASDAWPV